uniref:Uncharacterized protein n=1 Tax=Sphaerodactylus townsendi TaxID=933632 RepID=A0ACB8FRD8_9SAUR
MGDVHMKTRLGMYIQFTPTPSDPENKIHMAKLLLQGGSSLVVGHQIPAQPQATCSAYWGCLTGLKLMDFSKHPPKTYGFQFFFNCIQDCAKWEDGENNTSVILWETLPAFEPVYIFISTMKINAWGDVRSELE